jgi:hypothetical protein
MYAGGAYAVRFANESNPTLESINEINKNVAPATEIVPVARGRFLVRSTRRSKSRSQISLRTHAALWSRVLPMANMRVCIIKWFKGSWIEYAAMVSPQANSWSIWRRAASRATPTRGPEHQNASKREFVESSQLVIIVPGCCLAWGRGIFRGQYRG